MEYSRAQEVSFAPAYAPDSLHLFELDADLVKVLSSGERLEFVGAPEDELVCCSAERTYRVKKVESSNTTLVLEAAGSHDRGQENSSGGRNAHVTNSKNDLKTADLNVVSTVKCTYELVREAPDFSILRGLLRQSPLTLIEACAAGEGGNTEAMEIVGSDNVARGLYNFAALRARIRASDAELRGELEAAGAFEAEDGSWRILAPECLRAVFGSILDGIDEMGWSIKAIPEKNAVAYVRDVHGTLPTRVIMRCLSLHGSRAEAEGGDALWALDGARVATFRAEQLLRCGSTTVGQRVADVARVGAQAAPTAGVGAAGGSAPAADRAWPLDRFMDEWRASLPQGVDVDESLLRGRALFGESLPLARGKGVQRTVQALPIAELAPGADARMAQLFAIRPKWTLEQLRPFILDLCGPGKGTTEGQLLLKHCRSSVQVVRGGEKIRVFNRR
jgi:sister chromatid cohesion protein DCC1